MVYVNTITSASNVSASGLDVGPYATVIVQAVAAGYVSMVASSTATQTTSSTGFSLTAGASLEFDAKTKSYLSWVSAAGTPADLKVFTRHKP